MKKLPEKYAHLQDKVTRYNRVEYEGKMADRWTYFEDGVERAIVEFVDEPLEQGLVITTNFSQELDDVFGKLIIAPTVKAQKMWDMWRKNPTMFTFAPGYIAKYAEDGTTIIEAELVELSIIPKVLEKKDEDDTSRP